MIQNIAAIATVSLIVGWGIFKAIRFFKTPPKDTKNPCGKGCGCK